MRVFVAGASGAIGTRLVPQLMDRGHEVIGTFRSPGNAERVRALGAEAIALDLLDAREAGVRRFAAQSFAAYRYAREGTESRGASNGKAKRELGWTLCYPSWRQGFPAAYGQPKPLQARA